MSEVMLNLLDNNGAISGTIHSSIGDAVVAALSAEPETIAELEAALERFIKPVDDRKFFASFCYRLNEEPWDAGIVIVDLTARIVAIKSSYSAPGPRGHITYHNGSEATDIWISYRVPDDWRFLKSITRYHAVCEKRRRSRSEPPLDARVVLYGSAMIDFIVNECLKASHQEVRPSVIGHESGGHPGQNPTEDSDFGDPEEIDDRSPIPEIHASWLMTRRADLRGKMPRELIVEKLDFIDFDLESRAQQWAFLREGPPPLSRTSFAYLFGGFDTHEYVVYYHLVRHLVRECWKQVQSNPQLEAAAETSRLERIKEAWLNAPLPEFDERVPAALIESARRRIPIALSPKEMMVDEDCELCRMLGEGSPEEMGPGFWYLDGCNIDDGFAFSTDRTLDEWEANDRCRRELAQAFKRKWGLEKSDGADEGDLPTWEAQEDQSEFH